ncbi:MAG: phage tail protein [Oscillospiraceae bacterium]|nr:phage tail protein [Oscillospiraceae bacterium]
MKITYQEPFRAFRFLVEVENAGVVAAAFSQFSGVKMDVDTIQIRSGNDVRGVQETVPVFTRFAPVTLTKGVIGDNDFIDWLFSAAAGPNAGPSGENLYRTLNIVALDEKGNRGVTWSLKNALPIGYELTPMNGGRSEVLSESLTFAIMGMERKTHTPQKEVR